MLFQVSMPIDSVCEAADDEEGLYVLSILLFGKIRVTYRCYVASFVCSSTLPQLGSLRQEADADTPKEAESESEETEEKVPADQAPSCTAPFASIRKQTILAGSQSQTSIKQILHVGFFLPSHHHIIPVTPSF